MDFYIKKRINAIKKATNDKEIEIILNRIYEDGFQDGLEEC